MFMCFVWNLVFFVLCGILISGSWANPGILSDGYSYPQPPPQPPLQFDEPSSPKPPAYLPPPLPGPFQEDIPQIPPTYLPPNLYPPIGSPPYEDEFPPFDDTIVVPSPPSNQYLPPPSNDFFPSPPSNQYLPPSNDYLPPKVGSSRQAQVRVINMSCLDPRDGSGYFRAVFRPVSSTRTVPVIESSPTSCLVAPVTSDVYRIDLEGSRMVECGVRSCANRMCITLRMATVPGLRLADDSLVNLQCIPQETVVAHTKHLRVNTQAEQGRSGVRSISVASGGNQRRFETQLNLLRRSAENGGFDQPVQQGSAVRLGDDLMLRAAVREGDGWRYSRMGSVTIRSAASQKSVVMVDENGCRSPALKSVCPQHPQQISPLIVQMPFKAFLFQGAVPADDLLLSVRMLGCLRSRDCQSKSCDDNRNRLKRDAGNFTASGEVTNLESEIQFRVLPREIPTENPQQTTGNYNVVNFLTLSCFVALAGILVCVIIVALKPIKK